jgi:hypothetical protein
LLETRERDALCTAGDAVRSTLTLIQVLAKLLELPEFEVRYHDPFPGVARTDERGVHELEHRTLAEGVRDHLRAPALLAEEPLEHVRRLPLR